MSSGFFGIIGVCVGVIIGFLLNLCREYWQEKQQKRKYLNDLLKDLEFNKKLAEESKIYGYHTLGYTDAKGAKYLFELPDDLRNKIYSAFAIIFSLYDSGLHLTNQERQTRVEELKKLLEEIIPHFKNYLGNK